MAGVVSKILVSIAWKLLTETFVARVFVHMGRALAASTKNQLDDKLVDDAAQALGVQ